MYRRRQKQATLAGTGPGAAAPVNLLRMISEIITEEEELKCAEQAQPRCDFSAFAQQPSQAAASGPQLGGLAEAEGQCFKVGKTPIPLRRVVWVPVDRQAMAYPDNEVLIGK